MSKMSICNDCACGVYECEWMQRLEPVKGWKARKVKYKVDGGITFTYNVQACPKFKPMPERPVESVPRGTTTIQEVQAESEHQYQYLTERVKRVCVFGRTHFCNGELNRSEGGKEARKPCDFYIDNKCTYPPIALLKAIQRK